MSVPVRLAAALVALAVVLLAGLGLGRLAGPVGGAPAPAGMTGGDGMTSSSPPLHQLRVHAEQPVPSPEA